jgi:hypothetical protein
VRQSCRNFKSTTLVLLIETIGGNRDRDLARTGINEGGKGEDHAVAQPADDADHEEKSEKAGHATTQVLRKRPAVGEAIFPAETC